MTEKLKVPAQLRKFATVLWPQDAEPPILSKPMRETIHQWLTEIWAEEELRRVGVSPRRTAMLSGPPGCGKTTLAHHLAARLGIALVCVRTDDIGSSYMHQTGSNMGEIFGALAGQERLCILLFDEFDSFAVKRGNGNQAADLDRNNVVNILLQRIESYSGTIIAATNRGEKIDPAIWRRFGLHMTIDLPGDEERFAILTRYLEPMTLPEEAMNALCDATAGAPPALLRQMMENIKRDMVLAPRLKLPTAAGDVLRRVTASVQPHAEYGRPPLWDDQNVFDRVCRMPWPPVLSQEAAA